MSDGIWSALSGAVAQVTALDVAANNMANASTPGFRGDYVVFREQLSKAASRGRANRNLRFGTAGSVVAKIGGGEIMQTGRALDVAIRGDGFFAVSTSRGERLTRLGAFEVGKGGVLANRDGDPVLGVDRRPIRARADAKDVRIEADGSVLADGNKVGQVLVVASPNPASLQKEGPLLYRVGSGTQAPAAIQTELKPGYLEAADVSAVQGMMQIVAATRSFEACERAIDAFKDADRRAAMAIMGRE
jgi:flagellar basal body rod protein FlgG